MYLSSLHTLFYEQTIIYLSMLWLRGFSVSSTCLLWIVLLDHCYIWLLMHICTRVFWIYVAAAAAKSLQSCPTLWPHRWQPTRLPCPWDSPGKNTGVRCQFLLQCMKVKSESEVTQSCPTLQDPMDCSLQGSSIHGIFQARVLEWGVIAFSDGYMLLLLLLLLLSHFSRVRPCATP